MRSGYEVDQALKQAFTNERKLRLMATKFFDATAYHTAALEAAKIKQGGFSAVAGYYFHSSAFKQIINKPDARLLQAESVYTLAVWENGYPTTPGYFTRTQGAYDAAGAIMRAVNAGQPKGTPIYAAYDCDLTDMQVINAYGYAGAFHDALKAAGFLASAYGPGALLDYLHTAGYICNTGWLSQSTGFNGYDRWKPQATIIQGAETHMLGLDVDTDTAQLGNAGGWFPV